MVKRFLAGVILALILTGGAVAGPFEEADAAFQRGDYRTALRLWRPLAEQGNATAQFALGKMYVHGEGVPQDDAEALKWYRLAAEQGYADAQSNLGAMYALGRGVSEDDAEALKWYRLAAEQGDAAAQYVLGKVHQDGEGVPQDDAEALKWYRLAAEQGQPDAQFNLGVMYAMGQGVPQDDAEAVKWWRLAAQNATGLMDHGTRAQNALGQMYADGEVPQDYAEAVKWYRLAAEQGDAAAQFNLGVMYAMGQGVPQDYVEAHKCFNLAASRFSASDAENRDKAVKARDSIASQMTPEQLAEAQKLAREWRPTPQLSQTSTSATSVTYGAAEIQAAPVVPVPRSGSDLPTNTVQQPAPSASVPTESAATIQQWCAKAMALLAMGGNAYLMQALMEKMRNRGCMN